MSDDGTEMEALMPFVCVATEGGPYPDDAFCAGWTGGLIWARLERQPDEYADTVPAPIVRQLDLMAMHFGYRMEYTETDYPEWMHVRFAKLVEEDVDAV
jgi:hypothetical protein